MTESEIELLRRELGEATNYFEYGAGESTKLAADCTNLNLIASVESDQNFIEDQVRPDPAVAAREADGSLRFLSIDVGPTGRWGRPVDNSAKAYWPGYPLAIKAGEALDPVLVDGIFRVACVAAAALYYPNARVLVHDFWRRKRYRPVFKFCEEVESADELVILRKKGLVDEKVIKAVFARYCHLPSDVTFVQSVAKRVGFRA